MAVVHPQDEVVGRLRRRQRNGGLYELRDRQSFDGHMAEPIGIEELAQARPGANLPSMIRTVVSRVS
jgi:hypothetical protein